jgi:vacuolar-type H+-ATPase subunit H
LSQGIYTTDASVNTAKGMGFMGALISKIKTQKKRNDQALLKNPQKIANFEPNLPSLQTESMKKNRHELQQWRKKTRKHAQLNFNILHYV